MGWTGPTRAWPAPLGAVLRLSVPGAITWLLQALEYGVINRLLLGLPDQTTAIASFAVYLQLLTLSLMPAAGTAVAVVPYVARLLPTGDVGRIRRELRATMVGVVALALLMTSCIGWLFAEPIAAFFVKQREMRGDAVAPPALGALRLLPVGALAAAPFFVLRPVFEAAQRPRAGIEISVARFVVLSLPGLWAGRYLGPAVGLDALRGMILGLAAANAVAAVWARRRIHALLRAERAA